MSTTQPYYEEFIAKQLEESQAKDELIAVLSSALTNLKQELSKYTTSSESPSHPPSCGLTEKPISEVKETVLECDLSTGTCKQAESPPTSQELIPYPTEKTELQNIISSLLSRQPSPKPEPQSPEPIRPPSRAASPPLVFTPVVWEKEYGGEEVGQIQSEEKEKEQIATLENIATVYYQQLRQCFERLLHKQIQCKELKQQSEQELQKLQEAIQEKIDFHNKQFQQLRILLITITEKLLLIQNPDPIVGEVLTMIKSFSS